MPHPKITILLIALLTAFALAEGDGHLDAVLQTALRRYESGNWQGRVAGAHLDNSKLTVLAKVQNPSVKQQIERLGGRVTSTHGDIVVVNLTLSRLQSLASLPGVERVEASYSLFPMLDEVAASTGANLDPLKLERPDVTGKGVLVGIIDTGIDTTLAAFQNPDGTSRIAYFWNFLFLTPERQPTVTFADGTTETFSFGGEFTKADIDSGEFVGMDTDGHGTHVAGIAAANDPDYPGMAPESTLISVVNESDNLEAGEDFFILSESGPNLDAYSYLIGRRDEMDLPLVVNQSQGTLMGPHDGSSLYEQALQNDIEDHNLIICIAAGNDRLVEKHAQDVIPANGTAVVDFQFDQDTPEVDRYLANSMELWFAQGPEPELSLELYSDDTYTTQIGSVGPISFQADGEFPISNSNRAVTLDKELPSSLNGDNRFFLTFTGPEDEELFFRLRLTNNNGSSADGDLYVQQGTESIFLTDLAAETGTLVAPSTTPGAITVGAFATRTSFVNSLGGISTEIGATLYDLAPFSSIGPPRNLNLYTGVNSTKPDLCAPGVAVISQMSSQCSPEECPPQEIFQDQKHVVFSGTSMASPVVAGVVALMLQDNPQATPSEIKSWLTQTARTDSFTGATPNSEWGHGKIDAQAAFDAVVSPPPQALNLEELEPISDETRRFKLTGRNLAVTHQLLINGVALPADAIQWINHKEVQFSLPSGQAVDVISYLNTKAPAGENSSHLVLNTSTNPSLFAPDNSNGFCFIATAAYGSHLEPEVKTFRHFRDTYLAHNRVGQWVIKTYYQNSPRLAQIISGNETLKSVARFVLTPLAFIVRHLLLSFCLMVLGLGGLIRVLWRRRLVRVLVAG